MTLSFPPLTDEELYHQAVELVCRVRKASISLLQRRLRIGYQRASRIIATMEENNIIGAEEGGSTPRKVLVSSPPLDPSPSVASPLKSSTLKRRQQALQVQKRGREGYVYLIQSPTGAYKIGHTIDPDNRIRTFSVKLPFEVHYVCLLKSESYAALETIIHNFFHHKRIDGEWFALSEEDVVLFKALKLFSDNERIFILETYPRTA